MADTPRIDHRHHGPPWDGESPWRRREGPRSGRRFRRLALAIFAFVVLLVGVLASLVASALAGRAPHLWITVPVAAIVIVALFASARSLWRSTRAVGALMDAADRVAAGDYAARVDPANPRQLRRLGEAFNQMSERLETNEARRRELLADVAHEIRTPLQVIRGSVEGMLDDLYPTDPEHLRPVLDGTVIMARLLDDLRTLSMAEEGMLILHRETIDPRAIAEDAARSFAPAASEAGVDLGVEIDLPPAWIEADPVRVSEVLSNLLSNAIRHTPDGGRVTVLVSAHDGTGVRFAVSDTGPGIRAEDLPRIFDRFVRSADAGGSGLGLTIAKRLVEAHGGTIDAARRPEGGTCISFTIPGEPREPLA